MGSDGDFVVNVKEHIEYWLKSSAHDMDVADTLFQN